MNQKRLHEAVAALAILRDVKEHKNIYLDALQNSVIAALKNINVDESLKTKLRNTDHITMKYIFVSLHVIKQLAVNTKDDVQNLISIQQQQRIKILLQILFSVGVLPSLVQGVDIPLANKTIQLGLFSLSGWTLPESYFMMREVLNTLLGVLNSPNLRSLILIHLGDLMAALLQLINIADIKKPSKIQHQPPDKDKKCPFDIEQTWYEDLIKQRSEFKAAYNDLVSHIYKPLVIKELLILLTPLCSISDKNKQLVPPAWMKRTVSKQLSAYLLSPGGVALIMRAMCDSTSEDINRKKVSTMAKVISTVHGCYSCDEFYESIGPQIIALLNTTGAYCVPVATQCIKNVYEQNVDICNKYILDKLFEPFLICSKEVNENFSGTIISEASLSRCIEHLETCFTPEIEEIAIPIIAMKKIMKIQFVLYCKIMESAYEHKTAIEDFLIRFLCESNDIQELTAIYNNFLFDEKHPDILDMNPALNFEFGPSGGVQVCKTSKNEHTEVQSIFELKAEVAGDALMTLFGKYEYEGNRAMYDLFVILLKSLINFCYDDISMDAATNKDLLDADDVIMYYIEKSQKRLITIKLIVGLSENQSLMEAIQEDPDVVVKFLVNFMEKKAKDMSENKPAAESSDEDGIEDNDDDKDILVALGVIDILTANLRPHCDKWFEYKQLLKPMKLIKESTNDTLLKTFILQMHHRIITHGSLSKEYKFPNKRYGKTCTIMDIIADTFNEMKLDEINIKVKAEKECYKKNKKIKILEECEPELEVGGGGEEEDDNTPDAQKKKEYVELGKIIDMLCDTDIPTRGHGLIRLKDLINKRDPDVVNGKNFVFSVLKSNLNHKDSFIYLAAINGLEALSNLYPDMVIGILTREFLDTGHCPEVTMKIGEVLVKISKQLGDSAPKFKNLLVNAFLVLAKDKNEYVRASSLSNLAEILKILGYCVGPIVNEIFECVSAIAKSDQSVIVRRAAIMVAHLMLQGVTVSTFMVIEPVIRDLYRLLNVLYKTDKDDVTRLHAQLAIDEIDRIVRSIFHKNKKLEKRIYVLDFPR